MSNWNSEPDRPPHTLRFALGEIAIICKRSNRFGDSYTGTPCEVVQVGPFLTRGKFFDYIVQLCDSTVVAIDDEYLKKFEPPADDIDIAETEESEETV